MDVVVKGRRAKVPAQVRERFERKIGRLARLDHGIQRVELEVIEEATPRIDGGHRIEAAARTARQTFRATGTGSDLDAALEKVVERLERQVVAAHGKRRARLMDGAHRVKSGGSTPGRAAPVEDEADEA